MDAELQSLTCHQILKYDDIDQSFFCRQCILKIPLTTALTSFQEASATCCEPPDPFRPGYALFSPDAFEAAPTQRFSNGWDEEALRQDLQGGCEDCFAIDSMRKQFRDLYTQYQALCTAYNQARRDLDTQVQRTKSVDSVLHMERNLRVEMEMRCQILQHAVDTIESSKHEADKQQMGTIAKLTDILHASRIVDEYVGSGSKQES